MNTVWLRALIILVLTNAAAVTLASDWTLQSSETEPVTLWVQQNTTKPYLLVRADIIISAPVGPLLSLLQDAANQHQWLPYTHAVHVLERPAPLQTRVHFLTQTRWPFKPRDAITLFEIIEETPSRLRINMINQADYQAPEPGYLRIQKAEGYWQLTAQGQCRTHVRYQSGSQWGGLIPQWLVDHSNQQLAQEALINLKAWAETHYQEYTSYESLDLLTAHHDCR